MQMSMSHPMASLDASSGAWAAMREHAVIRLSKSWPVRLIEALEKEWDALQVQELDRAFLSTTRGMSYADPIEYSREH